MNSVSKLIAILVLLTGSQISYAQFKKIQFDPKVKIENKDQKLAQKENITKANESKLSDVTFKSLDIVSLNALKSGLNPGKINDRKVPTYIEGSLKSTGKRGLTTENLALEYLDAAAPLMQIKEPTQEFKIKSIEQDALEMTHVRLQQMVKGLPVYGAEIIIHGEGQNFDFLNGTYFPTIEMENVTPVYESHQTISIAETDLGGAVKYENEVSNVGDLTPKSNLVIYPHNDKFTLAYHITMYKNLVDRWEYFIDANTGEVINKYTSICKFHNHKHGKGEQCNSLKQEAGSTSESVLLDGKATATAQDLFNINRTINTYEVSSKFYMIDGSRDIFASTPAKLPNDPEGVIWTIDAFNTSPAKDNFNYDHVISNNNVWSNKTAVSAHYNGGKAFEYFRNVHNRRSINGAGGNIISLINVADEDGSSMGNAFWNGQAMFYGNGDGAFQPLARGLDVAGHEMTHGVIQSTANLEYQGESGALNESFADVFGAMIDRDDWKIGEDVVKSSAFPSGALRDLENPHNGASTNNFNDGWQPRHYDERYKGNEDNGGVHINSGIPNWAFFKFATAVGKDKAEKVYYRALSNYLTKSSKFVDCRVAVIKAATDLYSTAEINAAKKAFDEVGILGESGGNYETDINANPGQEFILTTGANNSGLFIYNTNGQNLGQISTKSVLSKPSISDDGSEIVYVGTDNIMYYIQIDWSQNPVTPKEQVLSENPVWRNAIISKDGLKIAAITTEEINEIYVFYFGTTPTSSSIFELYNPTYTQGVTTGDVNYADAMEFDITGEYIMYDAENEIKSNTSGSIQYWDISFIKVWNNASKSFSLGEVEKLYSSLPSGVSIGNPTFSKNSPYIIAFDYIDDNGDVSILGGNIENGNVSLINENNTLGYPNYSSKDDRVVFDNEGSTAINVRVATLKSNKIEAAAAPSVFTTNRRWAVWFSNGKRTLSSVDFNENLNAGFTIIENPTNNTLRINVNGNVYNKNTDLRITDISGKIIIQKTLNISNENDVVEININELNNGIYFVTLQQGAEINTLRFIKN
jgi:Zn-dependent metalloprotease